MLTDRHKALEVSCDEEYDLVRERITKRIQDEMVNSAEEWCDRHPGRVVKFYSGMGVSFFDVDGVTVGDVTHTVNSGQVEPVTGLPVDDLKELEQLEQWCMSLEDKYGIGLDDFGVVVPKEEVPDGNELPAV